MMEIVIPELNEMRTAHLVSIGSEMLSSVNPYCEEGYDSLPLCKGTLVDCCIPKLELRVFHKFLELFRMKDDGIFNSIWPPSFFLSVGKG